MGWTALNKTFDLVHVINGRRYSFPSFANYTEQQHM